MGWGTNHGLATSVGLARPAFVRRELDRLGLGTELSVFQYGGQRYRLPPSERVAHAPGEREAAIA
jgi:hypothetical protein